MPNTNTELKTLANCTLTEFLKQSNKIRKEIAAYLEKTKVLDLRSAMPDVPKDATKEQAEKIIADGLKANTSAMLDAMLEENADDTVKILGLLCFKEGDEINELNPADILGVVLEILSSKRVLDFFTSLMQSGLINMANTSLK